MLIVGIGGACSCWWQQTVVSGTQKPTVFLTLRAAGSSQIQVSSDRRSGELLHRNLACSSAVQGCLRRRNGEVPMFHKGKAEWPLSQTWDFREERDLSSPAVWGTPTKGGNLEMSCTSPGSAGTPSLETQGIISNGVWLISIGGLPP